MIVNSSSVQIQACDVLQVCPFVDDIACEVPSITLVNLTLNVIAILLNILHIIVLSRMQSLQDLSTYKMVLQHIAAADLLSAASMIIRGNCELRHVMLDNVLVSAAMLSMLTDIAPTYRMYILALASCERYLAVCQPYGHTEHFINKYTRLSIGGVWIVAMLVVMSRDLIFHEHMCLHPLLGPTILKDYGVLSIDLVSTLISWLVVIVSLVSTTEGLANLKQRRLRTYKDIQIITSAHFITVICLVSIIKLIPLVLIVVLYFFSINQPIFNSLAGVLCALYGSTNAAIYSCMVRSHRAEVRQLFCCSSREIAPYPQGTRITVLGAELNYNQNIRA